MQSKATTVRQYLSELPPDRRAALTVVREVILKNLDKDFEEGMQGGMIGYYVPHRIFPAGYHCDPRQPLPFAGLASQKNYLSVYIMCLYSQGSEESWFRSAWAKTGKKLDMGKCCVRFKKLDDLALEVIGEAIRRVPAEAYIEHYQGSIRTMNKRSSARAAGSKTASLRVGSSKPVTSKVAKKSPTRSTRAVKTATTARRTKTGRGGP